MQPHHRTFKSYTRRRCDPLHLQIAKVVSKSGRHARVLRCHVIEVLSDSNECAVGLDKSPTDNDISSNKCGDTKALSKSVNAAHDRKTRQVKRQWYRDKMASQWLSRRCRIPVVITITCRVSRCVTPAFLPYLTFLIGTTGLSHHYRRHGRGLDRSFRPDRRAAICTPAVRSGYRSGSCRSPAPAEEVRVERSGTVTTPPLPLLSSQLGKALTDDFRLPLHASSTEIQRQQKQNPTYHHLNNHGGRKRLQMASTRFEEQQDRASRQLLV